MGRFKLQTRLMMLCALLLALTAVVGVSSYISSDGVSKKYEDLVSSTLPKRTKVHNLYEHFLVIRMNLRNLGLPGISTEQSEESLKLVSASIADAEKDQKEYEALGFSSAQKELYEEQQLAWKKFLEVGQRVLAHYKAELPEIVQK